MKTKAKMETTVCLLCLPEQFKSYYEDNCTVVGYGRPSKAALNQFGRGIVMFFLIHTHTLFFRLVSLAAFGFGLFLSFCYQDIPNHSFSLILENVGQDLTDGILRKAEMPIVDTILCQEFLDVNARSDEMHSGFICAGGKGDEESCYVSTLSPQITWFSIARFPLTRFSLM